MDKPVYGEFKNGIPYVRFGEGERDLVVFSGGPGNEPPRGYALSMLKKGMGFLCDYYRIHLVTRKWGLKEGYTTRDMSNDYAEMIEAEFSGRVELVIGLSYGGMIAQHFAADHPQLFDHIVIAMAAHRVSKEGMLLDERFADLLSRGKYGAAYKTLASVLYPPGIRRSVMGSMMWLFGRSMKKPLRAAFRSDVLIEVRAEKEHDSRESLPKIAVPVLVICGDRDYYFPIELVREMERQIPKAMVRVYPGRGHDAFEDRRFANDVFDFVEGRLSL
jgi:pimeloyl-ACP methyl ester carboxylesterase